MEYSKFLDFQFLTSNVQLQNKSVLSGRRGSLPIASDEKNSAGTNHCFIYIITRNAGSEDRPALKQAYLKEDFPKLTRTYLLLASWGIKDYFIETVPFPS
jgi:hypothetical protein